MFSTLIIVLLAVGLDKLADYLIYLPIRGEFDQPR